MRKTQYSTLPLALLALFSAAHAQGFFRLSPHSTLLDPAGSAVVLRIRNPTTLPAHPPADFNALGPRSNPLLWHHGLPYFESLALSSQLASDQSNSVVDVYAPGFVLEVQDFVQIAVRPRLRDRTLIGYLSDDSLPWAPYRDPSLLLAAYLAEPWSGRDGGRQHAVDFLRLRYASSISALRLAWQIPAGDFTTLRPPARPNAAFIADAAAFAVQVLARYLSVVAAAVHRDDPNHLFLGAPLEFSPAVPLGSIWRIPDIIWLRLTPNQDPAVTIARASKLTAHPLLVQFPNCLPVPITLSHLLGTAC